ncbi:MAG: GNAT family acetyltransferase [Pseudomonadota bacterium]
MNPVGLSIRAFEPDDRKALIALWMDCGLIREWNDPNQDIELFLATQSAEIFLAHQGKRLVGCCAIGHDGHRGWVYYLGVLPELRGAGIGQTLMGHVEDWLRDQGIPKLQLLVRPDNIGVLTFYARIGYQPNGCQIMQRWLDGREAPGIETTRDDGKLETVITYLEMTERPLLRHVPPPFGLKTALLHAEQPTVAFYRFLYDKVGGPWLWFERRAMDDETLTKIIHDKGVEIYVLYANGVPAGFAELDRRQEPEIELTYFGLMPEFIGKGLGKYLLTWAIERAWSYEPTRLWVNTNQLDHHQALAVYQKCGFSPYKQEHKVIDDPRLNGLIEV